MATIRIILWKHQKNKDGTYPLRIRITKDRKVKYISLGYSLKISDFNEREGKVKNTFPNSVRLNNLIAKRVSEIQAAALELETVNACTTLRQIEQRIKSPYNKKDYFAFAESYIQKFNNPDQFGSFKKYKSKIRKLKTFLHGKGLSFHEIDPSFLREYETYLKAIGNGVNTINVDMRAIRAIYYAAIREGFADQAKNPFFSYKLSTKKTYKERLSTEELERIRALKLIEGSLIWHVRNIFLFSFNTMGMRFGDVTTLRWSNIHEDRVVYKMRKTWESKSIKLSKEAKKILTFYMEADVKQDDYIFPFIDMKAPNLFNAKSSANALVNKYLKFISEKAEIFRKISFHSSRHTWAQVAKNHKLDIRFIQKGLGHGSSKTTEIYLNELNDTDIDEANLRILNTQ